MSYREYQDGKYTIREYSNGNKCWIFNGKYHREDGPAIEWANGTKEWLFNNKLHREDGPAIEFANGDKDWYLNDVKYTPEEYIQVLIKYHERNQVTEEQFLKDIS